MTFQRDSFVVGNDRRMILANSLQVSNLPFVNKNKDYFFVDQIKPDKRILAIAVKQLTSIQ
jgi:hypothetical protein